MRKYSQYITLICGMGIGGSLASCSGPIENRPTTITIKNTSGELLEEKAIMVSRELFENAPAGKHPLLLDLNQDSIPGQLSDVDGDGQWDELFFLLDLPAQSENSLSLQWMDEPLEWKERTYVRFGVRPSEGDTVRPATKDTFYPNELPGVMGYQPYQTDGPSWENDKVGFRHYLDGRNSKDVFGKKVEEMSPRDVGINAEGVTEDNYHVMENWGRDILSVGTSVGIGGYSLMIGDSLVRLGVTQRDSLNNVAETTFEVLESGPIRSVMRYDYKDWKPENTDRTYQVQEISQIWPGMYGYQSSVSFQNLQGDETGVIGLVNIHTEKELGIMEVGDFTILYTHDQQTYDKEWYLGLALLIPSEVYKGWTEAPKTGQLTNSFLAKVEIEEGKSLDYYVVAAWELADLGFREEEYFKNYLKNLGSQLSVKPIITIENP
ncbi:hypothetical protein GCM10028791_08270 [Echinicola sediminis]